MKHLSFSFRLIPCLLLFVLFAGSLAAQFEMSFGLLSKHEKCWDSKVLPGPSGAPGGYVVLANQNEATATLGPTQIVLIRLDAKGKSLLDFPSVINDLEFPGNSYFGKAIELDYNPDGTLAGYYITGYKLSPKGKQMIVIHTDITGKPTATYILPNLDGTGGPMPLLEESGVSIERQSGGDIVVVGSSKNSSGLSKIVIARFSRDLGTVRWCNRYASTLSLEPKEACNGARPFNPMDPTPNADIAVTGVCGNRTLLFIVNAWNGAIVQAKMLKSGGDMDQGMDIVYRPPINLHTPGYYMIVGNAQRGTGTPQMWALRLISGASGTGSGSGVMYLGESSIDFTANAVSLSIDGTKAVVAGRIGFHAGGPFAFAAELSFSENAAAGWAQYYTGSKADPDATESIFRITGDPAEQGYFITSGGVLSDDDVYGMHAIRVNSDGDNMTDCTVTPIVYTPVSYLESSVLTSGKVNTQDWYLENLEKSVRNCEVVKCAPQLRQGSTERLAETSNAVSESPELALSPNPTPEGSNAQIRFDLPEAQTILLSIWHLTGRQVRSVTHDLTKGEQMLELSSAALLPGVYLVRINGKSGARTFKWLIEAR